MKFCHSCGQFLGWGTKLNSSYICTLATDLFVGTALIWLSILDLFGLSESEATVPQTNRKRKMPWCTQLMMREKFKIRSSLFNLLQPVEVDGHIFQQAGLLNELQHCFLSAQPLLLSVHLWGMSQDVVTPPLCNYLNRKENKQVSNSLAIPMRGSCDQQQSSGWRRRRFIYSLKMLVCVCLCLPGG